MADIETKQLISWLRDKACRADNPSWTRMMNKAADRLKELDAENDELKQRLFVLKEFGQAQNQKTGHWIIRSSGTGSNATNWAECSECHVCGSPQWKVCPVCETKMEIEV